MRHLALTALLCPLIPLGAAAQQTGIAFVQAPEQAQGMATGATPEAALATATAQCVDGGALAEDCLPTNWCYPAGWSIDIFAQHQEGLHWHEVLCGLPTREVAESVATAMCNAADRPYLIECALVQVYDPQGAAQIAEDAGVPPSK